MFRTALERRGVQILEAPDARQAWRSCAQERPEVVVLDLGVGRCGRLVPACGVRERADRATARNWSSWEICVAANWPPTSTWYANPIITVR